MASEIFHYGLMINGELIGVGKEAGVQEAIDSLLEDFIAYSIPRGGKIKHFLGLVWDHNGMVRAQMDRA